MTQRETQMARVAEMRARAATLYGVSAAPGPAVFDSGQPVLTGHYSQAAHERVMARAHAAWTKQSEAYSASVLLSRQADALENVIAGTVYDDDSDAVEQFARRIAICDREIARVRVMTGIGPLARQDAINSVKRRRRALTVRLRALEVPA